jgi:endonuclease/exonuclease/phosphatase family metal-dependent hydrolase
MTRELVAASYNIRKCMGADGRFDPDRVLDVIDEMGADLVVLQEADRRFGLRTATLGTPLLAARGWKAVPLNRRPESMGWHGNALLVRPDMAVARHHALALPSLEPRGAVMADLSIGDRLLRVVGAHLDLSGLMRRRQLRLLADRLAAEPGDPPTLLMGDLNEWRQGPHVLDRLQTMLRAVPLPPSFPARLPVGRLDRILVNAHVYVAEAGVHDSRKARLASDHLPVWVRLIPRAHP